MGLDISVLKPIKVEETTDKDDLYSFILSENPELEIFPDFIYDKVNTYYDLEGELSKLGYNLENVQTIGVEFGKRAIFDYRDLTHKLYDTYTYLDEIWSKVYFDTRKELFESEEYSKYLTFLPLLKEYGYKPSYKFFASGSGKTYYCLNSARKFADKKTSVTVINPKTFDKTERSIETKEVGYQRKGANTLFYENNIWDSPCITSKDILLNHWETYFSKKTPESKGGWGSGVEFTLEDDEMKSNFKKNIIDNFIEGENFVVYF